MHFGDVLGGNMIWDNYQTGAPTLIFQFLQQMEAAHCRQLTMLSGL